MVGLMFVYSTAAYIQSYKHMINRWTDQMLNSDLVVATSTLLRSTSYHFSEDLGKRIGALPEVKRVENIRFTIVPYNGDTAAVSASEMDGFLARASGAVLGSNKRTAGALLQRGEGVLVSKNFAARWRLRVGDKVHGSTDSWTAGGLPVG
jgi:hypothetical protein